MLRLGAHEPIDVGTGTFWISVFVFFWLRDPCLYATAFCSYRCGCRMSAAMILLCSCCSGVADVPERPVAGTPAASVYRAFRTVEEAIVFTVLWLHDNRGHDLDHRAVQDMDKIEFVQAMRCLRECCRPQVGNASFELQHSIQQYMQMNRMRRERELSLLLPDDPEPNQEQ